MPHCTEILREQGLTPGCPSSLTPEPQPRALFCNLASEDPDSSLCAVGFSKFSEGLPGIRQIPILQNPAFEKSVEVGRTNLQLHFVG